MSTLPNKPANYAVLAEHISGWTTNLLVAAIVIAIGLALGWQITGWFHESPSQPPLNEAAAVAAKLPPVENEREFWTTGGLVKVQRKAGTPAAAMDSMRAFCREKPVALQPRDIGHGEAAFVKQLLEERPLEESPPIAVYQPPGQAAMIVAIDRDAKRIVAWSFAAPTPGGGWSLYHFRPK